MAPSLGGRRRVWGDGKMTFIQKKFTFYRQKFLMTFLNMVIDHVSRIFPLFALIFPDLYFVRYHTQPFPYKKNTFSHFASKIFLMTFLVIDQVFRIFTDLLNVVDDPSYMTLSSQENTFFTLFILSRTSDNTTSKNIGGTNAWAVPTSNFGWTVPPDPLG